MKKRNYPNLETDIRTLINTVHALRQKNEELKSCAEEFKHMAIKAEVRIQQLEAALRTSNEFMTANHPRFGKSINEIDWDFILAVQSQAFSAPSAPPEPCYNGRHEKQEDGTCFTCDKNPPREDQP